MKLPPYGRAVAFAPLGYWERGTRVLIFAGDRAWDFCRAWLDVGTFEMPQARHRYTTILPPGNDPSLMRWPVKGRGVVIVECGEVADEHAGLIQALQRDGCLDGEVFDIAAQRPHPLGWEWQLRALQPWSRATFDAEVMRAHREQVERELREAEEGYLEAWLYKVTRTPGAAEFVDSCPPGSVGAEIARRLALRAQAEAA